MKWLHAAREWMRALFLRAREDADTDEELRFHVDMETQRLMRERGLSEGEARRQAAVSFGGVEKFKEQVRDARGFAWLSSLSLDLKLAGRMLLKYPGLTVVGVLGMAVAIAISATFVGMLHAYVTPRIPLEEGDRLVGLQNWDTQKGEKDPHLLHDFVQWRRELKKVEQLSAYASMRRNLIGADGSAAVVHIAAITASAFQVARISPLLGRPLLPEDELPDAPAVVVIGFDAWQTRFAGDPNIIGRTLRLGENVFTIVGVMPAGYTFPVNFGFWIPLKVNPTDYARRAGPELQVFGRLAEGASFEEAKAELRAWGQRMAADYPQTDQHRSPGVVRFNDSFFVVGAGGSRLQLLILQMLISMMLVVVAVNVAILVYARTVTRWAEIAARSALGASRIRIVSQLFTEALTLSAVAGIIGVTVASLVMRFLHNLLVSIAADYGGLPFWLKPGLPGAAIVYVMVLVVLGAVIVGVLPALQATGSNLQTGIRQLGGGTGMQLGRTWTVLIVAQVAVVVGMLPLSVVSIIEYARYGYAQPGFPADQYIVSVIEMDRATVPTAQAEQYSAAFEARYADRLLELQRRLAAQPTVAATTLALNVPAEELTGAIEVEGVAVADRASGNDIRYTRVAPDFFATFDVQVVAGRGFGDSDARGTATPVIVNRAFVQDFLGGSNALGRRVRYRTSASWDASEAVQVGQWYEIVGVVENLPANRFNLDPSLARVYHPLRPGEGHPLSIAVRLRGTTPAAFASTLRRTISAVDPALRAHELAPLSDRYEHGDRSFLRIGLLAMVSITLAVMLLSAAGIYALMSFTVNRRRREIGIRAALGADARRLLGGIFRRAFRQLAMGVAAGAAFAFLASSSLNPQQRTELPMATTIVAIAVLGMGILGAYGPARRGLRVQPTEALKGAD